MNQYREQVLNDLVELELLHTYQMINGKKIYTYEFEGYDKDKFESEGSIWIVYIYDCMSEYYHKNKEYFDKWVNEVLLDSIN